jgi:hypothetical protein
VNIEDILSEEELQTVKEHAAIDAPYTLIREKFPRLTKFEVSVFFEYYKKLKENRIAGRASIGAKEEPYYTSEDIDEIYPKYSWRELSLDEKSWYNIRVKNNIK